MEFRLLHDYVLKIEPEKEKAQQVKAYHQAKGKELVCRKEGLNPLLDFIYGGNDHLFKGRLQLSKTKNAISIYMSGNIIGTVEARSFLEGLDKL